MKLQDLLFTGMNVVNEIRKLLKKFEATSGMTESELKAYKIGVENALRAAEVLLESDDHIVFHIEGHNAIEEFDLDELIEICEEKENN